MTDHYSLLEVPSDADDATIKRAWARLVRIHTPDQDPEGNRRLSEAKAVLLDSRARTDYDAQLQFGAEITELFEKAHEAMDSEDYDDAVLTLKEILALHPKSLEARNQLALCYGYLERYPEAIKQFEKLFEIVPDSGLYASNFGHTYFNWDNGDEANIDRAEMWFKKATELEPHNAGHFISLSNVYVRKRDFSKAEAALENAIEADGKTDIDDIDVMMELTWIYLFAKQPARISGLAERVAAVLPDDPEIRQYAAHRFLHTAVLLADDHTNYQDAKIFVQAAKQITPLIGNSLSSAAIIEEGAIAEIEADKMKDSSIEPRVIPALLAMIVYRRLGFEISDDTIDKLHNAANTWSNTEVRAAVAACRSRFPNACRTINEAVTAVSSLGTSYSPASSSSSGGGGGGCAFLVIVAIIGGIWMLNKGSTSSAPSNAPTIYDSSSSASSASGTTDYQYSAPVPYEPPIVSEPKPPTNPARLRNGGRILKDKGPSGLGELSIENGTEEDAAVKLAKVGSTKAYRYYYIRKGETFVIPKIAPGAYEVYVRTGVDWDRKKRKFRFYEALSTCDGEDSSFVFSETREEGGIRYSQWSLTLQPVVGGTVKRRDVSENEFGED